jgi:hypothetical protein
MAYWPYRFVTDTDADDLLRLFEEVRAAGRHLALMAHYSHPNELRPKVAREAVRRIIDTGAVMRCQAPLIRHVNDDADTWAEMWRRQVAQGAVPYYMFVERDTGAKRYFEVPLYRAHQIFHGAYQQISGLCRTVRGPSMSATPGKVHVNGTAEIHGEKVFVLSFLQARNPDWVGRPFFARYDENACWLDDLRPALGEERFFYEDELAAMQRGADAAPVTRATSRRWTRSSMDPVPGTYMNGGSTRERRPGGTDAHGTNGASTPTNGVGYRSRVGGGGGGASKPTEHARRQR